MKIVFLIAGLAVVAVAATFLRYESFDPCDWMEVDMVQVTGLPELVVQTRIRADFLLSGIVEPGVGDCLTSWWRFRLDGLPEESS